MTNITHSAAYFQRFSGVAQLYGQSALALFSQAHICVIGIGGVGSWAVEALARTGIGSITLIDMDDICVTNTNRQIHALHEYFGHSKTKVMAERILSINPECQVTCIDDFITKDNIFKLLDYNFSYVIDAIDSARNKAALLSYCCRYHIPVVTTGAAGGQIDPTKIAVVDLGKTIQDPLASKLRKRLKNDFYVVKNSNGNLNIDCVSSSEPLAYPQQNDSVCISHSTEDILKRIDCVTGFGATTMVTATFGFVAVSHALKKILENRCVIDSDSQFP